MFLNKVKQFFSEEKGAETLEWIVIAAVIILVGAAAYQAGGIGSIISDVFVKIKAIISAL